MCTTAYCAFCASKQARKVMVTDASSMVKASYMPALPRDHAPAKLTAAVSRSTVTSIPRACISVIGLTEECASCVALTEVGRATTDKFRGIKPSSK